MINVSDTFVAGKKNSYDFEEYASVSMEIDSWTNDNGSVTASHTAASAMSVKDDSIINIFAQSIELFGSSVAPWPTTKSIPEQVAGIFLTSESTSPKDEPAQSRLEANKPQIQSKLRRSTSTSRRISITRINEEIFIESQKIYNELDPIPIVSAGKAKHSQAGRSPSTVSAKDAENTLEAQKERSKASRLHNWLTSLYSRNVSNTQTTSTSAAPKDEESGINVGHFDRKPLKGVLKNSSAIASVQKSVSITETEIKSMSSSPTAKSKKTMKLRFDNEVSICETFHKEDYSRQSLDYVARQLTPSLALQIKKELNSVKQEMDIHDDARHLTQFYLIK